MTIDEIIAGGGVGRLMTWKQAVTVIIENPIGYGWGSEHLIIGRTGHNLFVESGISLITWLNIGCSVLDHYDWIPVCLEKAVDLRVGVVAASIIMLISFPGAHCCPGRFICLTLGVPHQILSETNIKKTIRGVNHEGFTCMPIKESASGVVTVLAQLLPRLSGNNTNIVLLASNRTVWCQLAMITLRLCHTITILEADGILRQSPV